jgi:hypothetical protein
MATNKPGRDPRVDENGMFTLEYRMSRLEEAVQELAGRLYVTIQYVDELEKAVTAVQGKTPPTPTKTLTLLSDD